ncbi:SusE domain-containing protein [Carboxylicivirga caseinilyticus]|uniref:SusE domain-containing protein n=1 Tax=Carboxylicivirga caseinilyticus TaxID=3417572 RepID=UPI003D334C30|nr:SusE domain-containing protein [Marinilabiliaceae bacterium A049]
MKKQIIYLSLLLLSVTLFSCNDDENNPILTHIEASQLNYLPSNMIVLETVETGTNPLLFTITWTETFFYLDGSDKSMPAGPVSYQLQIDLEGNNFANAKTLASTMQLYTDVFVADLNTFLLNEFEVQPAEAVNYEMRVVATYGEGNTNNVVNSANTLPVTITTYIPPTDIEPIYIIGDMQGWNNTSTEFMMYRNSSSSDDYTYTYTGFIAGNTYFKLCAESNLGTWDKMYCAGAGGVLEFGDFGAFFIETDGYYTITIDLGAMTWLIETYDASGATEWPVMNFVGAFSEWGATNEPNMVVSSYDPHQWSLDITLDNIEYGVKFRANNSWDNRWCPKVTTDTPWGVAELNPTTHDNNISLDEYGLGTYNIRFNDLTGHYVVMFQE